MTLHSSLNPAVYPRNCKSGGVRDPHILRGDDGWFRMVLTDMDWQQGKWSNHGIVMLKSRDLIHWVHHTVDFHLAYAGNN